MAEFNFDATNKHYKYTPKSNPKDLVEVEISDAKDATAFFPQVKVKRWDNEINASIRLKHDFITGKVSYSNDGTKITWQKGQWKAVFYDRPDASNEGGFEFEIHIPKKRPENCLEFSVNTKQLDWFYQPALTPEEIAEGANRPDNVVGSYAVYYKNCPANLIHPFDRSKITDEEWNQLALNGTHIARNNNEGQLEYFEYGKKYKAGKAFHLYRPHIVDSAGKETWGEWTLDETNGVLRLTCPKSFLDTAVYPVVVDPTLIYDGGEVPWPATMFWGYDERYGC